MDIPRDGLGLERKVGFGAAVADGALRGANKVLEVAALPFTAGYKLTRPKKGEKFPNTLFEDVVGMTTAFTVIPIETVLAVQSPTVRYSMLAANAIGAGAGLTQRFFARDRKRSFWEKFVERVQSAPRAIGRKVVSGVRGVPQTALAVGLGYLAASGLAAGHERLTKDLPVRKDLLNSHARAYRLEKDGMTHEFALLGEFHYYNSASSDYVAGLLGSGKFDVFLSEGVTGGTSAKGTLPPRMEAAFIAGSKFDSESADEVAQKYDIPIHALEAVNPSTGVRYGRQFCLPKRSMAKLSISSVEGLLAPSAYFAGVPMRHLPLYDPEGAFVAKESGDRSNLFMTGEALDYMRKNSSETPLIRIGVNHVSGMLHYLEGYGKLTEIPLDELGGSRQQLASSE